VIRPMSNLQSAVLWIALLHLPGCATETSGAKVDVSNVEVGMTQSQVLSILGQPLMHEAYGPTEFLFYPSSTGSNVPIAIVDGKVTSIGRAAYDIVVRSKAQSDGNVPQPRKKEAP
jgi:outer membrane protein assembly factor BamE (lipoprotein component of BamABCDE complex)